MTGGRGGQSPGRGRGRGRGGPAPRGGHSFTVDRGQSNRGRRGLGNSGARMGRSRYTINSAGNIEHLLIQCSLPDDSSMPTQTHFSDARSYTSGQALRETRYLAQLDATIARLRSVSSDQPPTRPPAANTPTSTPQSSPVPLLAKTQSRWGTVATLDPQAFLKFAGLGQGISKHPQQPPSATTALSPALAQPSASTLLETQSDENVVVKPGAGKANPSKIEEADVQTQTPTPVVAKEQVSVPNKAFPPHMVVKKEAGLASSRWATPTAPVKTVSFQLPPLAAPTQATPTQAASIPTAPPRAVTAPAATIQAADVQSATVQTQPVQVVAEQTDRTQMLRDHFVKVQRDNGPSRPGKARLTKAAINEDLTLELEQENNIVVCEMVEKNSVFDHKTGTQIITFRSATSAAAPLSAWTIYFQMPYQAKKFHELVLKNRQGHPTTRPAVRRPPVEQTQAPTLPTPRVSSPIISQSIPQPLETGAHAVLKSSNEIPSIFGTSHPPTTQRLLPSQTESVAEVPAHHPVSKSVTVPSQLAWGDDVENLLQQQPIQFEQFALPTPAVEHNSGTLINTETFNDMAEVAGVAPLISFASGEPEPTAATSNSHGLNELFDEAMSLSTFLFLNKSPLGSLLDQLSRVVVKKGGPAAIGLTGDEILSSEIYMIAAYDLVGNFLSGSETFSRMPDDQSISMMKEQTRKVLELAVADREESVPTPVTAPSAPSPSSGHKEAEKEAQVVELQPESSSDEKAHAVEENAVPGADSRITYSIQDLMGLRQNAAGFQGERLSDEVVHLSRPQLTSSTVSNAGNPISFNNAPKNTVQPTSHAARNAAPIQQASAAPQAVASTVSTTSPAKPQRQQTDMNLWHTILNKDKGGKPAIVKPVVNEKMAEPTKTKVEVAQSIKQETTVSTEPVVVKFPIVSSGAQASSKHKTSNSDYESLAKTLEGFHLNTEIETVVSSAPIANDLVSQVQATPQVQVSQQPAGETLKLRLMEESILSRLSSPTLPSTPNPPVAAQTLLATNVNARLKALGAQLSPPTTTAIFAPLVAPKDAIEPQTDSAKAEVQSGACIPRLAGSTAALPDAARVHAPIAHHTNNPTRSTTLSPSTSAQVLSPPRPLSGAYANMHVASNGNLRGVPGLAASRWSSGGQGFASGPTTAPYTPVVTQSYMHSATANASHIPGSVPSRPPMPLPSNLAPVYQTILVQDEQGNFREVTGMVKTGSIPIVAHQVAEQQLPPVTPPNMGFTQVVLPTPTAPFSFPARPDMYNHHMSPGSDNSEQQLKPDAVPFRPQPRGRADEKAMPGARPALSPVRKGENVQAKLQNRLNNSLAGRGPFQQ